MRVSLTDAIRLALEKNLDLQFAESFPEISREQVGQALGAYDPLGFAEYKFDHRENLTASPVQSAFGSPTRIGEDQWDYIAGFRGVIPSGLSYGSTYRFSRLDSESGFFALERDNRPSVVTQATMPLLKDFLYNAADVNVKRSRIGSERSDEDFRAFVTNLVVNVDGQYWGVVALRASEGVAQKSLAVSRDLLEQTKVQYQVGVVSRVRVTEAEAGVAERESDYIRDANLARNAEDELLKTILAPDAEVYEATRLVTEDPTYVEYPVDEQSAIRRAMERRPELQAKRKQVEEAELLLAYAKNQRLPRLDLTGAYTVGGLSGPQKVPTGTPIPARAFAGPPVADINGDGVPDGQPVCNGTTFNGANCGLTPDSGFDEQSWDAHDDFFDASGAHGWTAGVHVEIPIGNRSAKHLVVQREIELRRARTDLKREEQNVILGVRTAARGVRDAIGALQAAARRRDAQAETLRAEQERLRLGDSTPREVLERERDLQQAERQVIFYGNRHRVAITEFEKSQATLLEARGIQPEMLLAP
jgi:outer membrane protein TolC